MELNGKSDTNNKNENENGTTVRERANTGGAYAHLSNLTEDTFTVEEAVEAIGFGRFQWILSMLTGCAWMADAMELMILSIISPQLKCEWRLYSYEEALITTVVFVGMMLSSSMWGNICDRYGRKLGLVLCVVWTFFYGFMSSFSPNFAWILILRGLVGFGVGGVPQSVTLYSEFLPVKSRAACIMLIDIFWAVGTCFEVALALIVMPRLGWRWLLGLSSLPLLLFSLACKWIPESPRYNVLSGNPDKAYDTLKRISITNKTAMPLGKLVCMRQEKRGRLQDLFETKELGKTTIMLWIIWFNCAFAYYGLVLLTTELFQVQESGEHCFNSINSTSDCNMQCRTLKTKDYVDLLWTTLAEFPGVLITLAIIEYIGRKKTIAIDLAGFTLFSFLLILCTSRPVMIFFLFVARAFISGAFQAAYVYTPEVYPTNIRAIGLGSCSGMARVGAIITPFIAQVMLRHSKPLTVSIYAVVSLLAAVCCLLLPIETKGRSMQESTSNKTSHESTDQ
uniref:synaptic vesicle 2-related protein n=1 Tax=Ciona intestinalis TaxID=7719 RepID=UPI000180D2AC|nr:synaptic vesicle 2-related protein [Ciona intestinalis]|eukprot:XP_018673260.1 synaptic vesicle 2-related protein [Ciona intestinalis]